jgi:hypothetical protein
VNALGWSLEKGREARPGPTIVVNQGDTVTVNLTSEDHLLHGLYIDYKGCGFVNYACAGNYFSPQTTGSITFPVPADTSGTFTYGDEVVALNVGSWAVYSPPAVTIRSPSSGTSWTGGVAHSISIDVSDPNGNPVQVWVNYSYGGGPSQPIRAFVAGPNPNLISWTPSGFSSMSTIVRVDAKNNRGGAVHVDSTPFEVDSTPPTIASSYPAPGATGVLLDAPIRVNWSEPMNRVTAAGPTGFGIRVVNGPWLAGTGTWSPDATRFAFQPAATLAAGAKYEVRVNASASDHSDPGNMFAAGPFVWTFTAGSTLGNPAPPTPTYQTPPLFEPFPWAVAGVTLGVILGALYGLAWRRKPA